MNSTNNNNSSSSLNADIIRILPLIRSRRNRVINFAIEALIIQLQNDSMNLQLQLQRAEQEVFTWTLNVVRESTRLWSQEFLMLIYQCNPFMFTVEERAPPTFNRIRHETFRTWWYVRHPYLTDDAGRNSFQLQYRMSRQNFEILLNMVRTHPVYSSPEDGNGTAVEIQVATVLWRIANTHFGYRLAEQFLGISAGSYCRFTDRFIEVMSDLSVDLIDWRVHDEATAAARAAEFLNGGRRGVRLPNVIGAIDGKLITIQKPSVHGNSWVDRHNNPSMNMLAVCDANKRFMFVRTGQTGMSTNIFVGCIILLTVFFFSGRVSDARLFTDSILYKKMLLDKDYYFPGQSIILGGKL